MNNISENLNKQLELLEKNAGETTSRLKYLSDYLMCRIQEAKSLASKSDFVNGSLSDIIDILVEVQGVLDKADEVDGMIPIDIISIDDVELNYE